MLSHSAQRLRRAWRAHVRSRRTVVWATLMTAVSVALMFVPLFNVLGFELSFAVALLASVASLDLSAAFVRTIRALPHNHIEDTDAPTTTVLATVAGAAVLNLSLLLIPLVIVCLNALRARTCDWEFGLKAFALLPGGSVVLASAIGVVVAMACGRQRRLGAVAPYLLVIASALYSIWQFYAAPPVFSYNLFVGYFPGNLYDENISLVAPFYAARLYHCLLVAALVAAASALIDIPTYSLTLRRSPSGSRAMCWVMSATCAAVALGLSFESGSLGFSIDASDIKRHLSGTYETDNFVIHYPRGGTIEREIEHIARDHEFRYAQLVRTFGVEVQRKITSFYFASPQDKFRYMGARNVYMAKPWRHEIYLHHYPFPHQILRHEIAHVLAGEFGDDIFHVSVRSGLRFNVGLIEGIAVAADWPDHFTRSLTPHQSVKAMQELGVAPRIDQIMSTGFLSFSSARSYTVAGSFVKFLLDTHGAPSVRRLYRSGGDFPAAFGQPRHQLVTAWRAYINEIQLPPGSADVVRERFRRPSIFHRPCPHATARRIAAADRHAANHKWNSAVSLLRAVCSDAPREPIYQLRLARLLLRKGSPGKATQRLREVAVAKDVSSTLRARAFMELAGIAVRAGQTSEGITLLTQASQLKLDDTTLRNVEARKLALSYTGRASSSLIAYFFADPKSPSTSSTLIGHAAAMVAIDSEFGLGHYLLGRSQRSAGTHGIAAQSLKTALTKGLPSPRFVREAARTLAESAFLAGDYATVRYAAQLLVKDDQPAVTRLYGADWLERLHWVSTGTLPTVSTSR